MTSTTSYHLVVVAATMLVHAAVCQIPLNPDGGQHRCGQCPRPDGDGGGATSSTTTTAALAEHIVCASDGRTYTACELRQARCLGHRVEASYSGNCSNGKRCLVQRAQARVQKDLLVPECTPDGGFSPVQCHPATGHCWCVDSLGKIVPGSTAANRRPNCKRIAACTSADRELFNGNLLDIFVREARRTQPANVTYSRAAEWKFRQLDRNGDLTLGAAEYHDLKRLVKRLVSPRSCARNFIKFSDRNNDEIITTSEWMNALGVGATDDDGDDETERDGTAGSHALPIPDELEVVPEQQANSNSHTNDEAPLEADDCSTARTTALERRRLGDTYVPDCGPDGAYREVQCHAGVCWCVTPKTGKPIQGTARKGSLVDCSTAKNMARALKGCPVKKKKLFAKYLISFFHMQRNAYTNMTVEQALLRTDSASVRNETVSWKFSSLDANRNGQLERNEWRTFRREWKSGPGAKALGVARRRQLRRCWRNAVNFCDENEDKSVSRREWTECSGLTLLQESPSAGRNGPNPFDHILKS